MTEFGDLVGGKRDAEIELAKGQARKLNGQERFLSTREWLDMNSMFGVKKEMVL